MKFTAFTILEVISFPQCDDLMIHKYTSVPQYGKCLSHVLNELYFWTLALWLIIDPCVNFGCVYCDFLVYIFLFLNFLRHQTMDKVQKYNSFKIFPRSSNFQIIERSETMRCR
jgi:hypothetical protein